MRYVINNCSIKSHKQLLLTKMTNVLCCGKGFTKTICNKIIQIINIIILYNFGLQIYNYSFNVSYNCFDFILNLNAETLKIAYFELFKLMGLLFGICGWVALYEAGIEKLSCRH